MAVALLVIGALMSGAGIYAVVFGYSIIQVEEGWASVISGATLFAGGIVTIALGLVLRVLKQVQTGLLDTPARVSRDKTAAGPPLLASTDAVDAPSLPAPEPTAADPAREHAPEESTFAARVEEPVVRASAIPGPTRELPVPTPTAERWSNVPNPADTAPSETPASDLYFSTQLHEPSAVSARPADDYKLETPSTAEHDLPSVDPYHTTKSAEEPPSPAMDDWLDRAFAELDRDNPPWPPRKSQSEAPTNAEAAAQNPASPSKPELLSPPLEPVIAEHAHSEPASEEATMVVPEPPASNSTPPEPQGAPSQSAVIGRYESDGTTYVMFADGSIEAQSASGVYRFASMAELKSYIEK